MSAIAKKEATTALEQSAGITRKEVLQKIKEQATANIVAAVLDNQGRLNLTGLREVGHLIEGLGFDKDGNINRIRFVKNQAALFKLEDIFAEAESGMPRGANLAALAEEFINRVSRESGGRITLTVTQAALVLAPAHPEFQRLIEIGTEVDETVRLVNPNGNGNGHRDEE